MKNENFENIVIGAGSGGLTVAIGLAMQGKKVALIESNYVGGDCTKLLHSVKNTYSSCGKLPPWR
jgi:pyruvate/2-oxoglutarate dehydrogenase complex dihydrolipoamide dehydrogenase (E3) component